METSAVQAAKLAIVAFTGLSKDELHVVMGLAVFLLAALSMRCPLRSAKPLLAVLLVALAGEVLDMGDELVHVGYWRWPMSLHDLLNTLLWPTGLLACARLVQRLRHFGA